MKNQEEKIRTTVRLPESIHRSLIERLHALRYTSGKLSIDAAVGIALRHWLQASTSDPKTGGHDPAALFAVSQPESIPEGCRAVVLPEEAALLVEKWRPLLELPEGAEIFNSFFRELGECRRECVKLARENERLKMSKSA